MKNHFRRSPVRTPHLRAVAIALMALQGPAYAVDYVWKGAHGNWDDPNQWTLLGVPGADDSVLLAAGSAALSSTRTVGSMRLTGGQVYGGDLTAGALNFEYGTLGGFTTNYATGATTITGSATFNGTRTQDINANHTLTLQGTSRWTAGSGAISSTVYGGAIVNNGSFADEGADGPTAYKTLRNGLPNGAGGTFTNNGTYVRTGLGTTRAYGLHNAGTLKVDAGTMELRGNGSSVGQVEVSSGARLSFHESSAVVSGRIANLGVVSFDRSDVTLTDTARLDGAVHVLDGWVYNNNASTISLLSMQGGGHLGGTGHWTVNTLDFQAGTLGGAPNYFPAGATTVTGTATFDGARNQGVSFNHTLTLQGNSRWTAGNGAISGSVFGGAIVNNATFEDAGAGSAADYKTLRGGGGTFINSGSYVRSGLGVTRAYGFDNRGVLSIASGTVDARDGFSNTGVVNIAAGAVLLTSAANAGRITGTGRVDTGGGNVALASSGTLDPGDGATLGTLTIEGGLRLTDGSVLRIDLGSAGLSDHLVVTNQASWDGELSVWLGQGAALQLGDVYTIASYGQRLAGSTFDSVSWHGVGAAQFSVEYGTDQLLLRVTAVPEPATYALWALAGVAGLQLYRRNRTIS